MSFIFDIKVVPSSGRNKCILDKSDTLKYYLKNPPEKGKANKELIQLLAKALKITQDKIEIITGLTSRKKKIKLGIDVTFEQLLAKLGIEQQTKLF